MSQYELLFQSTRIPRLGRDEIQPYQNSRHVVIQRGSRLYTMLILNEDGTVLPSNEIARSLQNILEEPVDTESVALGSLTTLDRDTWAEGRETILSTSSANAASLRDIDSALFAVCLEHEQPDESVPGSKNRLLLHGNGRNRWFDKSFQLVVLPDGTSAVNFEHSWGDGIAVLRFFEEVFDEASAAPVVTPSSSGKSTTNLKSVNIKIDESTKSLVAEAEAKFKSFVDSIDIALMETDAVSPAWVKENGLAVDPVQQLAFQLGYATMYDGQSASTYESANTAAFKKGRTEVSPCNGTHH